MGESVNKYHSIITHLTLMVTGILVTVVLVGGSLDLLGQHRQLRQALATKAASLVQFMAQVTPLGILSLNFVEMNNNAKKVVLTDGEAVYAVILNDQGIPLVYFFKDTDQSVTNEVRGLVEDRKPLAAIEAMKRTDRILEVNAPITTGEKRIGSAILGFSTEKMRRTLLTQITLIGLILVAIIGLSIALLQVVLRRILHPVQALTTAATQISTGDLNVMLTGTDRTDELGILSRSFESMVGQLRGLIAGLEKREHDLRRLTLFQRTILENAAYGIISAAPDGIVSSFNHAAERLLGYQADEVVGKLMPACWHDPEEITRRAQRLSEELGETIDPGFEVFAARPRRNLPEENEWTFIRKDGTRLPVLLSVTALRDESGGITGFVGLTYDLTERKAAEQERLAHLNFLACMDRINRAIQGTNDLERMMSDVLDVVLSIFDCNRAYLMYPCDPEAESWEIPMERTTPDYPGSLALGVDLSRDAGVAGKLRLLLSSDGPVNMGSGTPYMLSGATAERFGIRSMMAMAVYPKIGKPWEFGIHQCSYARVWNPEEERLFKEIGWRLADGLTSLLAYRDLQDSREKLVKAQRIAHIGYWDRDLDGNRMTLAEEACRIFGISAQESVYSLDEWHERWLSLIHPEDRIRASRALAEALRGDQNYAIEYRIVRSDGEIRHVHSEANVTHDETGRAVRMLGMMQDVTEQKEAEDGLRKLTKELDLRVKERTAELEAKNEELVRLNKVFIGRELRMTELKEKIRSLEERPS